MFAKTLVLFRRSLTLLAGTHLQCHLPPELSIRHITRLSRSFLFAVWDARRVLQKVSLEKTEDSPCIFLLLLSIFIGGSNKSQSKIWESSKRHPESSPAGSFSNSKDPRVSSLFLPLLQDGAIPNAFKLFLREMERNKMVSSEVTFFFNLWFLL